jgi:ParB/RepB/Spo0J family partition protein
VTEVLRETLTDDRIRTITESSRRVDEAFAAADIVVTDASTVTIRSGMVPRFVPITSLAFSESQTPAPTEQLVNSIHQSGLLVPVLVGPMSSGFYPVIDGRRRVLAARRLGIQDIPVVQVPAVEGTPPVVQAAIANAVRSHNLVAERDAIRHLQTMGHDDHQIATILGMSYPTLRRRMRFGNLLPIWIEALAAGTISQRTALRLAMLTDERQDYLRVAFERRQESGETPPFLLSWLAREERRAGLATLRGSGTIRVANPPITGLEFLRGASPIRVVSVTCDPASHTLVFGLTFEGGVRQNVRVAESQIMNALGSTGHPAEFSLDDVAFNATNRTLLLRLSNRRGHRTFTVTDEDLLNWAGVRLVSANEPAPAPPAPLPPLAGDVTIRDLEERHTWDGLLVWLRHADRLCPAELSDDTEEMHRHLDALRALARRQLAPTP